MPSAAACTMAVPVDPDAPAALLDYRRHEADDRGGARRRRVADGIGNAHPGRARANRRRIKPPQRLGIRARRIFGHIENRQAFANREANRLFRQLEELIDSPPFGVLPKRARPDERAAFNRNPDPLRDLDDRLDVGDERSRRAVGRQAQPLVDDLARQTLDVADDVRTCPGQAEVRRVDPQRVDDDLPAR